VPNKQISANNDQLKRTFIAAIRAGDVRKVKALLARHRWLRQNINASWHFFDSPIIFCADRNPRMIDALLAAGADINARSTWWAGGFGILDGATKAEAKFLMSRGAKVDAHSAAHLDMLDKLRELVSADPSVVHKRGGDGQSPLHFASTVRIAKFLLDHGANIDMRDIDHESTPAQWMLGKVGGGDRTRHDVARYLVKRGCQTDILMAAALGDAKLVRQHLDKNPDSIRMRVTDEFFSMIGGKTGGTIYQWTLGWYVSPHAVARKFGHKNIAAMLLRRSPPDVKLTEACWAGDKKTVQSLLKKNPRLVANLKPAAHRNVADAARENETKAVRMMLEIGFPVDARGQEGGTSLHWACWHGNLAMVKTILRHNPPLELTDTVHHSTPLGWAIYGSKHGWHPDRGNYPACVETLIKAGAKIPEKTDGSKEVKSMLRRHQVLGQGPLNSPKLANEEDSPHLSWLVGLGLRGGRVRGGAGRGVPRMTSLNRGSGTKYLHTSIVFFAPMTLRYSKMPSR
jgi:ankyrin repeat protein